MYYIKVDGRWLKDFVDDPRYVATTTWREHAAEFETFKSSREVAGKLDNAEIVQVTYMVVWDNKA